MSATEPKKTADQVENISPPPIDGGSEKKVEQGEEIEKIEVVVSDDRRSSIKKVEVFWVDENAKFIDGPAEEPEPFEHWYDYSEPRGLPQLVTPFYMDGKKILKWD